MTVPVSRTDKDWEKWGKENPYYGVLGTPRFLTSNLTEASLREFFSSGERHVEHVFRTITSRIQNNFAPDRILDYGCGTARLLIPFSRLSRTVVGVDVSRSVLAEARNNCQRYQADSVQLLHVDEFWSLPSCSFDLVHTFIVLQHIPVKRGEQIIMKLISLLRDGGVGAIHVTFANNRSMIRQLLSELPKRSTLLSGLVNLSRGYSFGRPAMQMNSYCLNRLFELLLKQQCSDVTTEFSDHDGFLGLVLYFRKARVPLL